jgi:hypothetical protein
MGNGPRAFCAEGTVKTLIYICIRTVGGRTKNTFRKELLLKGKREMIILIIFLTKKRLEKRGLAGDKYYNVEL